MDSLKLKNAGFSLVELIVTIAMASILVGGISLGISIMFSKDAAKCATTLNDALYTVRMNSMSKPGDYTLEIKDISTDSSKTQYVAEISCKVKKDDGSIEDLPNERIYLEGGEGENKVKTIDATIGDASSYTISSSDTVKITFDKSKGCVSTVNGSNMSNGGIVVFHIVPARGPETRSADVSLITATGKHTIGLVQ